MNLQRRSIQEEVGGTYRGRREWCGCLSGSNGFGTPTAGASSATSRVLRQVR